MQQLSPEVLADIQGIIFSGYRHLNFARYVFLRIEDAGASQAMASENRTSDSHRGTLACGRRLSDRVTGRPCQT